MADFDAYVSDYSEPDTDEFTRSNFSVKSVTIYVFVNGNSIYKGEEISKSLEIEMLKNYSDSVFTDPNSLYINIPTGEGNGKKAFDYLIELFNKKKNDHQLKFLDNWNIVPIFIQSNDILQLLSEYNLFFSHLTAYMNNNEKTYRLMPCVIFEGTDIRKNDPLMKQLLSDKEKWINSFPIMLVYPNTDFEQIEFENRIKTICMTVKLLQILPDLVPITAFDSQDWQCYSSRLLTISKPYHIEILLRAKNLLEFFLKRPENPEKNMKELASAISAVPYESVWKRWSGLPYTEGSNSTYERKKISVLPIYSMVFPDNSGRDDIKSIFKPFTEKYYYSHLPITTDDINSDSIRDKFFEKYKYGYGFYISAFDELFNAGKNRIFKENMLEAIEIEKYDKLSVSITDSFNELITKLVNELEKRTKRFYDIVFSDECVWYKKARENYKILNNSLTDLLFAINNKIKYWRGIEGDMTLPNDLWKDDDRKRLINSYIAILKSDKPEEDFFEKFVSSLFSIAKEGITGNRITYMDAFNAHSRDDTVVSSWQRLLTVPNYCIVPNGQSNMQNIVICDNPNMLDENSLRRINGDITHFLYTDSGVKDRIDYIVLSAVGKWNGIIDEGEN